MPGLKQALLILACACSFALSCTIALQPALDSLARSQAPSLRPLVGPSLQLDPTSCSADQFQSTLYAGQKHAWGHLFSLKLLVVFLAGATPGRDVFARESGA